MKSSFARTAFFSLCRLLIGSVLLYAGFLKAVGPTAEFIALIDAYKLLPHVLSPGFALILPYAEMSTGLFVLSGLYIRQACWVATFMFSVFLVALGSTFVRGIDLVSCGCFGQDALSPKITMGMDTLLGCLAVLLARFAPQPSPYSLDSWLK